MVTEAPDWRRTLQLALAGFWLLDAVLQYQTFMFSPGFARMLADSAAGNPAGVAGPVTWGAHLVSRYPAAATAAFGTVQLLLALGIAWRPTARAALAASAAWALAVWWLGEGLGGILTGAASPVTGAPGAAVVYALLAVLLWPRRPAAERDRPAPFAAARAVGAPAARALWLLLWGGMAWLAVLAIPGAPAGQDPAPPAGAMGAADPRWLRSLDAATSSLIGHHAGAATLVIAAVFVVIAVGVFLPAPAVRAVLCLAAVAALAMWAAGQDLGGLFTRTTTDPNSGPLLALLAAAYWPAARAVTRPASAAERPREPAAARVPGSPGPQPLPGVR